MVKYPQVLLFLLSATLVKGAQINEKFCDWEVEDRAAFTELALELQGGDRYVLGVLPAGEPPAIPGPLFMRPPRPAALGFGVGMGHDAAFRICSPQLAALYGYARFEDFTVIWNARIETFLVTFGASYLLEDVSRNLSAVQEKFGAGKLYFWPVTPLQKAVSALWSPEALPIVRNLEDRLFVPYALGRTYGRLRFIRAQDWSSARVERPPSRQDIVLLDSIPVDFDRPVAGVITSVPQSAFSHVNILCLQQSIPNAYIAGAWRLLEQMEGKLLLYEVTKEGYTLKEARLEEAQEFWALRKPPPLKITPPDFSYRELPSLDELAGTFRPDLVGGKAAYLAFFLPAIPPPNRVRGFVIPFAYFRDYLSANTFGDLTLAEVRSLWSRSHRFQSDPDFRYHQLVQFREAVEQSGRIDTDLIRRIANRTTQLFGSNRIKLRFRSSSNAEDALLFPAAGLYRSTSVCVADGLDEDASGPSLCDPMEAEERTVSRGLRRVWASLWNFPAYEQRQWYGVPEEATAMAVLVTPAFTGEAANGVALTGSPVDPTDHRYFVVAQAGEESVVRPEIDHTPELDLLSFEPFAVERATRSSLVDPGETVLTDAELQELGLILQALSRRWSPPQPFPVELVRLEVEFKLDVRRKLFIKQVRPYVLPGTSKLLQRLKPQRFEFPGTVYVNLASGIMTAREELARRILINLDAGKVELPGPGSEKHMKWIKEILLSGSKRFVPREPASLRLSLEYDRWTEGIVQAVWRFTQELEGPRPQSLAAHYGPLRLTLQLHGQSTPRLLVPPQIEVKGAEGIQAACINPRSASMPLFLYDLNAGRNGSLQFLVAKAQSAETSRGALLLAAAGKIMGESFFVRDSFKLAVGEGPRPVRTEYLIVVGDRNLPALAVQYHLGSADPTIQILDSELRQVRRIDVVDWKLQILSRASQAAFKRGDVDTDGAVSISDLYFLLSYLFRGGPLPPCPDAADLNDDGRLTVSDAVALLHIIYGPEYPDSSCAADLTEDSLPPCRYDPTVCLKHSR